MIRIGSLVVAILVGMLVGNLVAGLAMTIAAAVAPPNAALRVPVLLIGSELGGLIGFLKWRIGGRCHLRRSWLGALQPRR